MKEPTESWKITVLNPPYGQDMEQADLLMQFKKLRKKVMDDPNRGGTWQNAPLDRAGDDLASFAVATYRNEAGQDVVLSGIRFIMASDYDNMRDLTKSGTYDVLVSACPEVKDGQVRVTHVGMPASDIMPADIPPIEVAFALYDKTLEWAKEKKADIVVCAPMPRHAKMIERYCQFRKLPVDKLGDSFDTNLEGFTKPKVVLAMNLSDKVHFKLPAKAIS